MNTSNGFNSIQMFTAFLPEDFQIISAGQLKTRLGQLLSPTPEAVAVLGPFGDTPKSCWVRASSAERGVGVQNRLWGAG